MIQVHKTYRSDFGRIYPLLKEFNAPFTKADWNRLFSYRWDGDLDYIGFHLECAGQVVGFMGLIFSCRYKQDRPYKFCNITSLIVKKPYRAATLLLVRKVETLGDTICTGFNPIVESYRLFTMLGFTPFERQYTVIPTVNGLLSRRHEIGFYESSELLERVDAENRRIVVDHADLECESILFDSEDEHCLLIYKVTRQNYYSVSVTKVHMLYTSDVTLFNKYIHAILRVFWQKFGSCSAMYVDTRLVSKRNMFLSIAREINPPRICNSHYRDQIDIDQLYSEVALLPKPHSI